jgi:hypothetical protein
VPLVWGWTHGGRPCSAKKKKKKVAKSKEAKTGSNLVESSKEDYGSKRAVLPMIMMNNSFIEASGCSLFG